MEDGYDIALLAVADAYEAEVAERGGRSLARVATIVASSGAFFTRVRQGKSFSVANLDRFATWFRDPVNWPSGIIPNHAADALASIGRPPAIGSEHDTPYRMVRQDVRSNGVAAFDTARRA